MTHSKPTRGSEIAFREVTVENLRTICRLAVAPEQEKYVAPNAVSIAEAHYHDEAWFRAIYADETPVGFFMLEDRPDDPEYCLWRFMIDARFQGMGFGGRALTMIIEHVKTRPRATELLLCFVPGEGSPQGLYEKFGFELTGEEADGELVMRLLLV